jgi:hypothetical protein
MRILVRAEGVCSRMYSGCMLTVSSVCRADVVCHWEDTDAVAQEMFATVRVSLCVVLLSNGHPAQDSIICICVAFAVRTV